MIQHILNEQFKDTPIGDMFKKMTHEFLTSNETYSEFVERVWKKSQQDAEHKHQPIIAELHRIINNLKNINRDLTRKVSDLIQRNGEVRGELELMRGAHSELIKQKNNWEKNFYDLKALDDERLKVLNQENQDLFDKLYKQEEKTKELQKIIADWCMWADKEVSKNLDLSKRVATLEKNNEDLGKTLRYREDLNLGLSKKLGAAHKEINRLNDVLNKQEHVSEAADALERMIIHWQKPARCCP